MPSSTASAANSGNNDNGPSPEEIVALAKDCGYSEYRASVSATLYFLQDARQNEDDLLLSRPRVKIHVYFTTRSLMTMLGHPVAGTNRLWRSNAYRDLEDLRGLFERPREHTGKGYRDAKNAVRGCTGCGELKKRTEFSKNQWIKGPDENRCKNCVEQGKTGDNTNNNATANDLADSLRNSLTLRTGLAVVDVAVVDGLAESLRNSMTLNTGETNVDDLADSLRNSLTLTPEALARHNRSGDNNSKNKNSANAPRNELESRQFNCPECPRRGRPPHVFYKKVLKYKPIVKCPICKKITQGRCKRLVAVPRDAERGYGFYKCSKQTCGRSSWGSSRAVYGVGQECYGCKEKGVPNVMVPPFRMEIPKKKKPGQGGQPGRRRAVPKEPIAEDAPVEHSYTSRDERRNRSRASNALGGSVGSSNMSFEFVDGNNSGSIMSNMTYEFVDVSNSSDGNGSLAAASTTKARPKYAHKCSACSTGACRNRKIPVSQIHDTSDGNTVSTRNSIVTNSSIDKTEFVDRDEDFSAFEIDFSSYDNDDDSYASV